MENLTEVRISEYIPTIYMSRCTMEYKQNGEPKKQDICAPRDGATIIIYNSTRDVLVLIRQFRAAVYIHDVPAADRTPIIDVGRHGARGAVTLELCGGSVDKKLPVEQIAQEEVLEECGYKVPLTALEKVCEYQNGIDTEGARQVLFYCEVTDDMRVSDGGGVDDEIIEVVEMPVAEALRCLHLEETASPVNTFVGLYWFLENKYKNKL